MASRFNAGGNIQRNFRTRGPERRTIAELTYRVVVLSIPARSFFIGQVTRGVTWIAGTGVRPA